MRGPITEHRAGFGRGLTEITRHDDPHEPTGLGLAVLKLAAGENYRETTAVESAFLLMAGSVTVNSFAFPSPTGRGARGEGSQGLGVRNASDLEKHGGLEQVANRNAQLARTSLFDEAPSCVHVPAGIEVELSADSPTEFTVYRTGNRKRFEPRIFLPSDTPDEPRGKGQVGGACLRLVRTIFDRNNSDANAQLVLGEVVTLPGRWSSYPPHHHPQPEIYHYRFAHPQGYGHAELGDTVYKVRSNDTIKILAGNDHAQCAAPGYPMYYSWVIRHLENNPYTVPEFTAEHRWTMDPAAVTWQPKGV